eukprot:9802982-Lingulodinium_polyedra.AAC.1
MRREAPGDAPWACGGLAKQPPWWGNIIGVLAGLNILGQRRTEAGAGRVKRPVSTKDAVVC